MDYEAYLLGYNPTMHPEPVKKRVPSFWRDGHLDDWWSCTNLGAKPGDEFFLLRQGGGVPDVMKGIVGHGVITTPTYLRESNNQWDARCVNVRFDALTADSEPPIIPFAQLKTLPGGQHWSPKKSGIGVRPETLTVLREVWGHSLPRQAEGGPARRRQGLTTLREKQDTFKLGVKIKWDHRCALSRLTEGFCEVAHIFEYGKCDTEYEQIDPENGLLLAGHLHRAFDNHLLGIRPDGTVVWSRQVSREDRKGIGQLRRRIPVSSRARDYLERRFKAFLESEGVRPPSQPAPCTRPPVNFG